MMAGPAVSESLAYTIVTAQGRSAIATVILHGANVLNCVNENFNPAGKTNLDPTAVGKVVYGYWLVDGKQTEDLVVCPRTAGWCEVHCHGGDSASKVITRTLEQYGASEITPFEMATRIEGDRLMADLQLALSKTRTQRTATLLLNQIRIQPAFWQEVQKLRSGGDQHAAQNLIDSFLQWKEFGLRLTGDWKVVLCGAPNAGKSSLINTILGFQRSIVHSEKGTTRDAVDERTAIDGWPVRLFDTAGIRSASDQIEKQGIELSRQAIEQADLVVLIVDSCDTTGEQIEAQIAEIRPGLVIANKSDLKNCSHPAIDMHVSAKTSNGIAQLIERIGNAIVPDLPAADQPFPVSEFQVRWQELIEEPGSNRDHNTTN